MAESDAVRKRVEELRNRLMQDLSSDEIDNMQLKVDMLMRLAAMDAGHDHDSKGGVGHHDHNALADLSWRLEQPRAINVRQVATKAGSNS